MKVSIIIPVFNEENTIIKILKEVNNQVFEDFSLEIIVIDDCSQDSTVDLLKENSSLYTKLIMLGTNLGKGGAVKQGILESTGEYILFQDADLEYDPSDYKILLKPFESPKISAVYGSRVLNRNRYNNKNFTSNFRVFANHLLTIFSNLINHQF